MSFSKKIVDAIQDNREFFNACTAVLLGTSIGMTSCIVANKFNNKHVVSTCNKNLNEIVVVDTLAGSTYGCVSRKVLYGPSYPLKP